jgi:hypothetical protein
MKPNKSKTPNEGIKCRVDSCYYYLAGDNCGAEKIEVNSRGSEKEADCETFTIRDK